MKYTWTQSRCYLEQLTHTNMYRPRATFNHVVAVPGVKLTNCFPNLFSASVLCSICSKSLDWIDTAWFREDLAKQIVDTSPQEICTNFTLWCQFQAKHTGMMTLIFKTVLKCEHPYSSCPLSSSMTVSVFNPGHGVRIRSVLYSSLLISHSDSASALAKYEGKWQRYEGRKEHQSIYFRCMHYAFSRVTEMTDQSPKAMSNSASVRMPWVVHSEWTRERNCT